MSSSILALLKLVIKLMIYSYSSIRGTNALYVKHFKLVEMQCASPIFDVIFPAARYSVDGVSSVLLVAFTIMIFLSVESLVTPGPTSQGVVH